jgi:hypothetical protein
VDERPIIGHAENVDWSATLSNFLAGVGVAVVVALLAWLVTDRYAAARQAQAARQARNLAAAEELYTVYGHFFAAWKAWEHFKRRDGDDAGTSSDAQGWRDLLTLASEAEGAYESLIIRISLEKSLTDNDRRAMWALRFALKQLRYAIRNDQLLEWWRSDGPPASARAAGFRDYQAFKSLVLRVASILVDRKRSATPPSPAERARSLALITGTGFELTGTMRGFRKLRNDSRLGGRRAPDWVVVALLLDPSSRPGHGSAATPHRNDELGAR